MLLPVRCRQLPSGGAPGPAGRPWVSGANVTTTTGDAIAASGQPPTPEDGQRMSKIGADLERHSKLDLVLLLLAVTAMSTARYG